MPDIFKVIPLTKGFCAIISREDWRLVKKYKWYTHMSAGSRKKCGQPYARATINGKKVYLHRFVMGAENPELHVDHLNHQTLDCRRENLEVTDHITNMQRRRKKNGTKRITKKPESHDSGQAGNGTPSTTLGATSTECEKNMENRRYELPRNSRLPET